MTCRELFRVGSGVILFFGACSAAIMAQTYTADPGTWRPVAYSDLLFPRGEAESFASLWQDRLDESNRKSAPIDPGALNMSIAVGNRGASEWHFSINFQTKLVALSVLSTPHLCTDEYASPTQGIRIKVCPSRLATFENNSYSVIDGAACFIEKTPVAPAEDSTATVTYAAYDVPSRSIRLRYTVSHQEIDRCAQSVPLHPEIRRGSAPSAAEEKEQRHAAHRPSLAIEADHADDGASGRL